MSTATKPATEYLCPVHFVALRAVMSSGCGWCPVCGIYQQAHGVPMPTLPPEQIERREVARIEEQKRRRREAAKRKREAKA